MKKFPVQRSKGSNVTPRIAAAAVAAFMLALVARPVAHDIPTDVVVQAFLKPAGQRLALLVRVPLTAPLNVEFPRRGPGYVELEQLGPLLAHAAQGVAEGFELYEAESRLTDLRIVDTRISLPSDRSFRAYEQALAHVTGPPMPPQTNLYWNQGFVDALIEYPIRSDRSEFSVRPRMASLAMRVTTVLRFIPPSGTVRAFELVGDPGVVRLDPRWHQAALRFVESGFFHILDGTDHLLFLLCLVIPFRRFRSLIAVVTSFTVAHSMTLIASAYNVTPDAFWFPPLIETLIAMSIVYMALENIVAANLRRRWIITFGFGLVHGFGFSFALRETLQFAGSHLLTSLLSFNIGVELGQLLVLAVLIPLLTVFFRFVVAERIGTILLSALVAHTGWHWMMERGGRLSQYQWSARDYALLATGMGWLMVIAIVAGLIWLAFTVFWRPSAQRSEDAPAIQLEGK